MAFGTRGKFQNEVLPLDHGLISKEIGVKVIEA